MLTRLHTARAGAPTTLVLVGVVLLAGCGGSSSNGIAAKLPFEILAASRTAAESATSVHVSGRSSQGRLTSTSELWLASDGGRAQTSLLGAVYEAIRIGETAYVKGNPVFYENLNAVTANAVGKVPTGTWLKGSSDSGPVAEVAAVTDLRRELNVLLGVSGPLTKGATTTIDGQQAIELKESAKLYAGTLYIATTGKPYPIELVKHGRETGQTTFSDWNKPIPLSAPAKALAVK
jgi:hypothetical protein